MGMMAYSEASCSSVLSPRTLIGEDVRLTSMLMPPSANDLVEEGSVDKRHGASGVEEILIKFALVKSMQRLHQR